MKSLAISVIEREKVGKSNTRSLRNQGNVPCVLYGGEKQVCFYAHENDFRNLVYTPDVYVVELDINGEKKRSIMQDIQFHPVTDKILHIDFLEVFEDKEITIDIPVILNGQAIGIRDGGVLMFRRRKIVTRGFIDNLPDAIELDIEHLEIGQFIYIKDIEEDGCEFLAPDNAVIVGVKTARAAIEDELAAAEEEEEEERRAAMTQEERDKEDAEKAEAGTEDISTEDGGESKEETSEGDGDTPDAE
jgi:large subunit ribosomal protein L25